MHQILLFLLVTLCTASIIPTRPSLKNVTPIYHQFIQEAIICNDITTINLIFEYIHPSTPKLFLADHFDLAIKQGSDEILRVLLNSRDAVKHVSAKRSRLIRVAHEARRNTPILMRMLEISKKSKGCVLGMIKMVSQDELVENAAKEAEARGLFEMANTIRSYDWSTYDHISASSTDNSALFITFLKDLFLQDAKNGDFSASCFYLTIPFIKPLFQDALLIAVLHKNMDAIKELEIAIKPGMINHEALRLAAALKLPPYVISMLLGNVDGRRRPLMETIKYCIARGLVDVFMYLSKFYSAPSHVHIPNSHYDERTGMISTEKGPGFCIPSASSNFVQLVNIARECRADPLFLRILFSEDGQFAQGVTPYVKMNQYYQCLMQCTKVCNKWLRNQILLLANKAYQNLSQDVDWDPEFPELAAVLKMMSIIPELTLTIPQMNYDISLQVFDNYCDLVFSKQTSSSSSSSSDSDSDQQWNKKMLRTPSMPSSSTTSGSE